MRPLGSIRSPRLFGALLFWVLEREGAPTLKWLRGPVASFFAKTPHSAYLTHHWIAYVLFAALGVERTFRTLSSVATTAAAFVTTFALCALSYRYFETPLIEISHRRLRFLESSTTATFPGDRIRHGFCNDWGLRVYKRNFSHFTAESSRAFRY